MLRFLCIYLLVSALGVSQSDKKETCMVFWDHVSGNVQTQFVPQLKFIEGSGDLCVAVVVEPGKAGAPSECFAQLRNSVGAMVDSKVMRSITLAMMRWCCAFSVSVYVHLCHVRRSV